MVSKFFATIYYHPRYRGPRAHPPKWVSKDPTPCERGCCPARAEDVPFKSGRTEVDPKALSTYTHREVLQGILSIQEIEGRFPRWGVPLGIGDRSVWTPGGRAEGVYVWTVDLSSLARLNRWPKSPRELGSPPSMLISLLAITANALSSELRERNVCFRTDDDRYTPRSGRSGQVSRMSESDP